MRDGSSENGIAASSPASPLRPLTQLLALLVEEGHCDTKSVERARRVSEENVQRLDIVPSQRGLVTERGLAASYAKLRGLALAWPV
jgi:hypothetical protein